MLGCSEVFRPRTIGNCHRQDGGHDGLDIGCGSPGTSARFPARIINHVQPAAVEDTSTNIDG